MKSARLPSLIALRAFEAVARIGTMKEAAAELHVTPGAVSQLIKKLEEELSVTLFQRKSRELRLTEDGVKLSEGTHKAFDVLKQTVKELPSHQSDKAIVIACESMIATNWLAPRLGHMLELQDNLKVEVRSFKDVGELDLESVDILLTTEQLNHDGIQIECLGNETFSPIASPGYLKKGTGGSADYIVNETLLTVSGVSHCPMPSWQQWIDEHLCSDARQKSAIDFGSDLAQAIAATRAGAGLLLAPHALVFQDIHAGKLVQTSDKYLSSNVFYWMGTSTNRADCEVTLMLKDWLTNQMKLSLSGREKWTKQAGLANVYAIRNQRPMEEVNYASVQ